jgi:putative redox protein
MVNISIKYTGDLHSDATHGPSQSKIETDAPTDNKGKGEAFSPTDLVATALGTCMSTTMGIKAQELGIDLRGMTVSVQKEMSKDAPRRIVGLPSEIHIPLPKDRSAKCLSKPRSIVRCTKACLRKSIVR